MKEERKISFYLRALHSFKPFCLFLIHVIHVIRNNFYCFKKAVE